MFHRNVAITAMLLTGVLVCCPATSAQAGPLLDWLFHKHAAAPAIPVGTPYPVTAGYVPTVAGYAPYTAGYAVVPSPATLPYSTGYVPSTTGSAPYWTGYTPYGVAYASSAYGRSLAGSAPSTGYALPSYGAYYGAASPIVGSTGTGYLTQRPANDVIATAPAVAPSNAPITLVPDYRTTTARTPVTYYRPMLTTDPNTGAQVVTLAPCTSYEYQTQRVPTWGLTQVYNGGATLPSTTPTLPAMSPTWSLPRGGVPLAGPLPGTTPYSTAYGAVMYGGISPAPNAYGAGYGSNAYGPMPANSIVAPAPLAGSVITPAAPTTGSAYSSGYGGYASNYGNYSTLQVPATAPPASSYPTAPYGAGGLPPYYGPAGTAGSTGSGSTGGGSTGTYLPPSTVNPYANSPYANSPYANSAGSVPGSIAVPGSNSGSISPVLPPTGVYPPSGASSDPSANTVPSLPPLQSGARLESKPQLQNIVQQPMPGSASAPKADVQPETGKGLMPIPVPDDFQHEPRWNPGLLKEKDTTALQLQQHDAQIAWGSKPIRWASMKSSASRVRALEPPVQESVSARLRDKRRAVIDTTPEPEIPEIRLPPDIDTEVSKLLAPTAPQPIGKGGLADPARLRTDGWQAVR